MKWGGGGVGGLGLQHTAALVLQPDSCSALVASQELQDVDTKQGPPYSQDISGTTSIPLISLTLLMRAELSSVITTYSQNRDTLLCRGVTKNLTTSKMKKIIFKKYHGKAYDQSFPMMYNTI